jgi:MOSC domain-containing protein YiiM
MSLSSQVISVNLGSSREVSFGGKTITTGFFKEPILGSAEVGLMGLEGDQQADLTVHGGKDKAVYAYPKEHYASWHALLDGAPLPPGSFGENLTTEGYIETEIFIGDVLRVGETLLRVTQPRSPCFKLQFRFQRPDAVALFVKQGFPGWYTSVVRTGRIGRDDHIEIVDRRQSRVSIADVWSLSFQRSANPEEWRWIEGLVFLPDFWKERIYRSANA